LKPSSLISDFLSFRSAFYLIYSSHLNFVKTLSFKEYGIYIYKDKKPLVSLTFTDDIKLIRTFDKKYKVPVMLKGYFTDAENGKIILQRLQILNFIHVQLSNRLELLEI
jgi:hypothetical protein